MKLCAVDGVKIAGLCACVPDIIVDNMEAGAELFGDRIADTIKVTGIKERRVCPPGVTCLDLSIAAARRLVDESCVSTSDIGGMIFVTQTPDYDMPNNASHAAHMLGLSQDCAAFDAALGCSGYVYGLWLASMTAKSLNAPVLLLDGEAHSIFTSPKDRATALLFGDAGSATLITPDNPAETWHFGFLTDGSKYDVLMVPYGRSRHPFDEHSLEYKEWPDGGVRRPIDIYMDGMKVFDFVVRNVPKCLRSLFEYAGISADSTDILLLHQANLFMMQQVAVQLGIPRDKMPVSLDRYGNSSSATIPVTVCSEIASIMREKNSRAILAGYGAGLSIAVASIRLGPCVCPGLMQYNSN